jgi:hypothetical protein
VEGVRTLKWIRNKYKNETKDERAWVLSNFDSQLNFTAWGIDEEATSKETVDPLFEVWFELLQDALEDPNLGVTLSTTLEWDPVLSHFCHQMNQALQFFERTGHEAFFEFAMEVHWRMTEFKFGGKRASQEWNAPVPDVWSKLNKVWGELFSLCLPSIFPPLLSAPSNFLMSSLHPPSVFPPSFLHFPSVLPPSSLHLPSASFCALQLPYVLPPSSLCPPSIFPLSSPLTYQRNPSLGKNALPMPNA